MLEDITKAKMTQVQKDCTTILENSGIADDKKAAFCSYVIRVERQARHARYFIPVLYLACGSAVYLLIQSRDLSPDQKDKFITGLLGCFTALLAFYKPSFQLKQSDCEKYLGTRLTGADLNLINSGLKVSNDFYDKVSKAIAALLSYWFLYRITLKSP